jgi:hypothetical protein
MAEHDDAATRRMILEEKQAMLRDLVQVLLPRLHRPEDAQAHGRDRQEDGPQGGWAPLRV